MVYSRLMSSVASLRALAITASCTLAACKTQTPAAADAGTTDSILPGSAIPNDASNVAIDFATALDGGIFGLGPDGEAGAAAPSLASSDPPFVFSESPAPNLIPTKPVRGVANGQPFAAEHVLFEATRREWRVSFCERALTRPTDFVHGQALHLYLHETIAVGKPIVHPMKNGGGYFAIRAAEAKNTEGTVSWTSEHAYYLEVTSMTMKPYDPAGPLVQEAGTASGRVYVAYRGGFRFLNSGIAGTFSNAVVRYYGKPFWVE